MPRHRVRFLQKITDAHDRDEKLANLLRDPYFKSGIDRTQTNWREAITAAARYGVPVPTFSYALSYYDGTARPYCRTICYKRNATTSARMRMSGWTLHVEVVPLGLAGGGASAERVPGVGPLSRFG